MTSPRKLRTFFIEHPASRAVKRPGLDVLALYSEPPNRKTTTFHSKPAFSHRSLPSELLIVTQRCNGSVKHVCLGVTNRSGLSKTSGNARREIDRLGELVSTRLTFSPTRTDSSRTTDLQGSSPSWRTT